MKNKKLFYILTFGIGYLIAKQKAKKIASTESTEIKQSKEINFDINELINYLGTIHNIDKVDATINCLIVTLKNKDNIDMDAFSKLGCNGLYVTDNKLNILFGNNSLEIKNRIEQELTKLN